MAVIPIPDKNVNLATNIRDVLNAHGSSCTNDVISFFDSRAVINQWSFRKPYATDADMFKLSDKQIRDINCGFTPKQIASYTSLPTVMDGGMNGWVYTRPSGGQYSPYRVGDYVGYDTDAPPMIQGFNVPSEVPKAETSTVDATAVITTSTGTNVTISDIGELSSYCPAVYLVNGDYSRMYESTTSIASGGFSAPIDISDMIEGTWTVYPFLKSGSTYYTIPNVESKTMKITASSFSVSLAAWRATDNSQTVEWRLTIKNSGSAVTWTNNNWTLTSKTAPSNSMGGPMDDIRVEANTTTTVTGSITDVNDALWSSMVLTLNMTLQSGNYTPSAVVVSMNT